MDTEPNHFATTMIASGDGATPRLASACDYRALEACLRAHNNDRTRCQAEWEAFRSAAHCAKPTAAAHAVAAASAAAAPVVVLDRYAEEAERASDTRSLMCAREGPDGTPTPFSSPTGPSVATTACACAPPHACDNTHGPCTGSRLHRRWRAGGGGRLRSGRVRRCRRRRRRRRMHGRRRGLAC
jgi:hypothetical protein